MRILLVIDNLGWGGAQRQMSNLGAGLARRGHEVHLFLYNPGFDHYAQPLRSEGAQIFEVEKRGKLGVNFITALARHMRRSRFDVAIGFMPTPATYAIAAARLSGNVPVIFSDRESFADGTVPISTRIRREPLRWAAHVVANSYTQAERLKAVWPSFEGRLSTIWNGIDTAHFNPSGREGPRGAGETLRLLGAGSVVPVKNLENLARALVLVAKRTQRPVTVEWAGKILDAAESRAVAAAVDGVLRVAGLSDRWRWLGLRDDLASLHGRCDALIHPSWSEGLPNAVCEALASGLPVLASRVCDHPRLVSEGERGFLFDPGDPQEMASAIDRLARLEPSALVAMARNARAFAEERLTIESCVDRYEDLIGRVVAARES